jgi:hypothetical protein
MIAAFTAGDGFIGGFLLAIVIVGWVIYSRNKNEYLEPYRDQLRREAEGISSEAAPGTARKLREREHEPDARPSQRNWDGRDGRPWPKHDGS